MRRVLFTAIFAAVCLAFLTTTTSAVVYVDATGGDNAYDGTTWATAKATISAAINIAGSVEEIWVKDGTYAISSSIQVNKAVSIYGGFPAAVPSPSWAQRDWENNVTTIDGQGTTIHCLYVGSNATIDGLAVTGGYSIGTIPADEGGGMYIYNCDPTITNCTFYDNYAEYRGGAICANFCDGGTISNCTFTGNISGGYGGAIHNYDSDLTITDCNFYDNKGDTGASTRGGAISNHTSSPTITDCNFTANRATNGAGIFNGSSCNANIVGCTFADCNSSTSNGGGIYNYQCSPTISKCVFYGNEVSWGGGAIYNGAGSENSCYPVITNCIIFDNSATFYGGGINNNTYSDPNITNCTIVGNDAGNSGGGIWNQWASPTLTNCILGNNEAPTGAEIHNYYPQSPVVANYCDIKGGYSGTNNINVDPNFADANNGDFHLLAGSLCIDAGDNSAPGIPSDDLDGNPRIVDGNDDGVDTVDMGAYEFGAWINDTPVYRFWSPVNERHFYTISESEKDKLINIYAHVWTYESIAYYAFGIDSVPGLVPVYRFWSPVLVAHFYTISESERDKLINIYPHVWTYEGIAFYAYPEGQQPGDAEEVYRFWSPVLETHFYTMNETEKNKLIDNYPHVWTYEGIAWYAYEQNKGHDISDVEAIKDALAGLEAAVESEDIDSAMYYFTAGYIHNGENRSRRENLFQDFFDTYQNIQVDFTNIQVVVDGDTATTTFHVKVTAEPQGGGTVETIVDEENSDDFLNYWLKEDGIWKIRGNQQRVGIDVDTKYWEFGSYQLRITANAAPGDAASISISGPSYLDTATVNNRPGDDPNRLYDDGQHYDEDANDGEWWVTLNINGIPTTSDTISFHITYSDLTEETKQYTIDGVFTETAALLSPPDGSTVDSLTPTFEWANLSIPVKDYSVQIDDLDGNRFYDVYNLPDGTTSYTIPPGWLSDGATYLWLVSAHDINGNSALTSWDIFTVNIGGE